MEMLRSMGGRQAASLALAGVLLWALAGVPADAQKARPAKPFKSFKLRTLAGEKKTFADYQDKLTLVAFFFPQCAFCKVSLPHVQKVYEKYRGRGLSVVLINVVGQEDKLIPSYLERHGLTLPVLTGGWQPALMRDYDLKATPTHILVDEKSAILFRQDGYSEGEEKALETRIAEALGVAM